MMHPKTLHITVSNASQAKLFLHFLKSQGIIYTNLEGEICVRDGHWMPSTGMIEGLIQANQRAPHRYPSMAVNKIFNKKDKNETAK